jgi:hypothetical protein
VVVNISQQKMSCFEGEQEVYFARVSTGALFNINGVRVDDMTVGGPTGTPAGTSIQVIDY